MAQTTSHGIFELSSIDHEVEKTVVQQELAALETLGETSRRIVCSMTRGPAKPINALGSATFRSPSMANEAVTPPVVGSVRIEMIGQTLDRRSRASAAEILAICIRDKRSLLHPRTAGAADTTIERDASSLPPLVRRRKGDLLADDASPSSRP